MVGSSARKSDFSPSSRSARSGLGPRVIFRGCAQRLQKPGLQAKPLRKTVQPPQPLAGEQHQIIEWQAAQPVADRRRIGNIQDRHHRATQGFGALLLEHLCEPVELARFGKGNPAAGERSMLGLSLIRRRT